MRGAIKLRPGDAHAMHGRLDDDVLFGMQAAADLVPAGRKGCPSLAAGSRPPDQWGTPAGAPL